jgi:hypothetical protein
LRIWTFHPRYLDRQGLLALWRESLLAQKVLRGETKGYTAHPQLERFRDHPDPAGAIGFYLAAVHDESSARGYDFDRSKIISESTVKGIEETRGQLIFEWRHFMAKIAVRDPGRHRSLKDLEDPEPHPLFRVVEGGVRTWERI